MSARGAPCSHLWAMGVVSKTSAVGDNVKRGSNDISTYHGTPLVGTRRRPPVRFERGGVAWVNVERLRIIAKVGTRQFECSVVQLVGFTG